MKKYVITNFGCQMNYADGERFSAIIELIPDFSQTDKLEEADLLILNSCSVRQKAEDRILGLGRIMEKLKDNNPKLKIVLTGCMSRRNWAGKDSKSPLQQNQSQREEELKKVMPWVDFVLESKDFHKLPELLGYKIESRIDDYLSFKPNLSSTFQAYVPISVGCDHFCSYCIVPFARGIEICRDASDIINEVKGLVVKGYKDIVLVGQTVNRYINPELEAFGKGLRGNTRIEGLNKELLNDLSKSPRDFLQLLQIIDAMEGDFWLSFMSSHPNYMSEQLIDFMSKSKHIRPYLHFALQSGSDRILKRMNRRYSAKEFFKIGKYMKKKIKGLGLSTDVIVGFPGETQEDLDMTAKLMSELEFDMAYISEYSPRKGTASALIKDDVPQSTKKNWKKYLNDEILAKTALRNNQKMLGKIFKCLIEKDLKGHNYLARTGNYKEIMFKAKDKRVGDFIELKVISVTPWALKGEALQ
jgi:tRNA-2-methylthio-N6-dimethylallyladenosine synthase